MLTNLLAGFVAPGIPSSRQRIRSINTNSTEGRIHSNWISFGRNVNLAFSYETPCRLRICPATKQPRIKQYRTPSILPAVARAPLSMPQRPYVIVCLPLVAEYSHPVFRRRRHRPHEGVSG